MLEAGMRIAALRLDERGAWEMDLDSGVTVRLGRREVDARRGAARKSVRVPNPAYDHGSGPRTLVRKQSVEGAVLHGRVARWPQEFRPDDYDWGLPIDCPAY